MHYFKIERARERGREGEASNATKFKNFACTAARNPQTHDPSGVSDASRSPPRAVPPGKAARVRNGRGLGHVRVTKPAQRRASLARSLPRHVPRGSEGGKRCKANFATLCLLSHNWHSRHAGVHSLTPPRLKPRCIAVATNTFQFPKNRMRGWWIGPLIHQSSNSGHNFTMTAVPLILKTTNASRVGWKSLPPMRCA